MTLIDQAANEIRISESLTVPLTEHAWSLLRGMTKRTGMNASAVIETALKGYSRAWTETE